MKANKLLMVLAITTAIGFTGCSPKDADIKAAVETKLKSKPDMMNVVADVKDGVATISGECKDATCKADCENMAKEVKGVKSVINNLSVAAPPPAPVAPPASLNTSLDASTQQKVRDGLKDIPGVTVEFSNDKAVLTGEVTKANRMKIMQILSSAKVKSDVSQLKDKK
ncbi:MAG: BON domain-containing protein [Ferruginibacter sp.]